MAVEAFDAASAEAVRSDLTACCASPRWVEEIIAGRPYGTAVAVTAASDQALAGLGWAEVLQALAAHPRIGEAATGTGREASWSRQEQSAAVGDDAGRRAFVAANRDYEDRFGWVFLVCASGRSQQQLLEALRERLGNDPTSEQAVVRSELAAIVGLRVGKMLG